MPTIETTFAKLSKHSRAMKKLSYTTNAEDIMKYPIGHVPKNAKIHLDFLLDAEAEQAKKILRK